jgi:hypothetical protein
MIFHKNNIRERSILRMTDRKCPCIPQTITIRCDGFDWSQPRSPGLDKNQNQFLPMYPYHDDDTENDIACHQTEPQQVKISGHKTYSLLDFDWNLIMVGLPN